MAVDQMMQKMQKPPVFIVGCPRSGTSLLRDLLNSHPNIKIPGETTVLVSFYNAFGDRLSAWSRKEAHWLFTHTKQFGRLGIDLPYDAIQHESSLSGLFDRAFQQFATQHGAMRWGEKTPDYALDLPTIRRMWPEAKFIHVIRDGRDVALSLKKVNFVAPKDTYMIARFWREVIETCRRDAETLSQGSFMELRFEDLLAHPKAKMRDILAFVGESFDEACLIPTRQYSSYDPEKRHDVASKTIQKDNMDKWKAGMSQDDLAVFEGVAGDLLTSLGYAPASAARRQPGGGEQWMRRAKDFWQRAYMRVRRNRDNPLDMATLYVYMHLMARKTLRKIMGRQPDEMELSD